MIIYLSLLVAVIGLVMYFICSNPKLEHVGEIMLCCGLLAFLLSAREALTVIGAH
jgi:Na+/phosphate symporter